MAGDWSFKKIATCFQVDPKIARNIFWSILEHIYKNQLAIPNFLSTSDGNEDIFQQMHDSLGKIIFFSLLAGNCKSSHIIKFNFLSWIDKFPTVYKTIHVWWKINILLKIIIKPSVWQVSKEPKTQIEKKTMWQTYRQKNIENIFSITIQLH